MSRTRPKGFKPQVGAKLPESFLAVVVEFQEPKPRASVLAAPGDFAARVKLHPLPAELHLALLADSGQTLAFDPATFKADAHDDDVLPPGSGGKQQLALTSVKISGYSSPSFHDDEV